MTIKTGNKAEIRAEIHQILLLQFYLLVDVFIDNLHSIEKNGIVLMWANLALGLFKIQACLSAFKV